MIFKHIHTYFNIVTVLPFQKWLKYEVVNYKQTCV